MYAIGPVTGEYESMNQNLPSILVISSCGKLKIVSLPNEPTCIDLLEHEQRESAKKEYKQSSTKAGYLYTGEQAKFVRKSVDVLRHFCLVDYKILSAGFGLVDEQESLPPYDCSFTNKTKKEIVDMAERLSIHNEIKHIAKKKYDLVYLALGKDYLTAVGDVNIFAPNSSLVVHFNPNLVYEAENIFSVNQKLIVGKKYNHQIFKSPIGGYIRAKGSLLLNYALDLKEQNSNPKKFDFRQWWEQKKVLL
ncbi:MAG: hypothetical protein HeimAB125_05940 [Candidatus Heimdallarchaeota archaeon AB_125]|nr:MAG: hypothetical protein HeimAB125_05940 [Candidatus Heimdallarchaeota archaeon AB_125]